MPAGRRSTVRLRTSATLIAWVGVPLLAGCARSETTDVPPPRYAIEPRPNVVSCAPAVLGRDDTLVLTMPVPHGPYLVAIAPDSTQFMVIYPAEDRSRSLRSLMPSDSFVNVTSLALPVRSARAAPWVFGRDTNEMLFARKGWYRMIVGSALESDGPIYGECLVRYVPD